MRALGERGSECCLAAIYVLRRRKVRLAFQSKKGRQMPAAFASSVQGPLFGRLLARRGEGAGIVDFRYLVIAEAEHLAQDLVGVLAEQRRTRHLAR